MRVAIVGAGAIGAAMAALVASRGHHPTLWSPSGNGTRVLAEGAPLVATGVLSGTFPVNVASSLAEVSRHDVVLIAMPVVAHRATMTALAPHVGAGQTVLVSGALSLSSLYLARLVAARHVALPVGCFSTTVLTARRTGPASVAVNTLRERLYLAATPVSAAGPMLATCRALFGDRFDVAPDALAISFANTNPVAHAGLAIGNATRIERAENWAQYQCLTGGVARLVLALDAERLAVARAFGYELRTIETIFRQSFALPEVPLAEQAAVLHERRGGPPGPTSLETRFVLEDAPFGLAFVARMGAAAGVATPATDAALEILSLLWGRDLRAANDLLPLLLPEGADLAALGAELRAGPDASAALPH